MPVTLDSLAAEDAAYAKQAQDAQATAAQQEGRAKQPPSLLQQWAGNVGRVTNSMLDSAVSEADAWGTAAKRVGQDAASGAVTGATNIADSAYSFVRSAAQNMAEPGYKQTQRDLSDEAAPPAPPSSPVWDHAKSTILDFRDAIAVQDPNIVDRLTQGGAQLAIPFAGYSRMLAGVHGFASIVASGAMTDLTALGPHDPRLADLIALGRHTEGKLGDALRTLAPDGSALNAYVNYLGDRGNESEAEGRFKNVLDGFGANLIVTPLLSAAASTLKQGTAGLRYLAENGVRDTIGGMVPPGKVGPGAQAGKIVFHGTPHDFDEFDSSKIGSGEGNQSYGHGLYFADNPDTAAHYREGLSRRGVTPGSSMDQALNAMQMSGGDAQKAYKSLTKLAAGAADPDKQQTLMSAAGIVRSGNATARGKLMHVDIPDEVLGQMWDYDKPLARQSASVKAAAEKVFGSIPEEKQSGIYLSAPDQFTTGRLHQAGVTGIRYLDAGSRGTGLATNISVRGKRLNPEDLKDIDGRADSEAVAVQWLSAEGNNEDEAISGLRKFAQQHPEKASTHKAAADLIEKGIVSGDGTRNYVLFDAKHAKIVKKE